MTSQDSSNGTLIFRLSVPGRTPLLNQILALGHWQRAKLKKKIHDDFLSALLQYVQGSETPMELWVNGTWTRYAMPDACRMIQQNFSTMRSRKGSVPKGKKNTPKSKSTK